MFSIPVLYKKDIAIGGRLQEKKMSKHECNLICCKPPDIFQKLHMRARAAAPTSGPTLENSKNHWWQKLLSHVQLFEAAWTVAPGTIAHQVPVSMNSPGKNTGAGCYFLLQGIFPTQGSDPSFLHHRQILYHLSHQVQTSVLGLKMFLGMLII